MTMDAALQVYIDESQELLAEMEAGLLRCERNAGDAETINSIFRVAHTIKGSAGLFGLDTIVSFVHIVETALDRVRIGTVEMDAEFAVLLLGCKDHIEALTAAALSGASGSDTLLDARSDELSMLLQAKAGAVGQTHRSTLPEAVKMAAAPLHAEDDGNAASTCWHVSVRFKPDVLRGGMDPLSFVRYLTTFGEIKGCVLVADALPSAEHFDPESCYLGFEIALNTSAPQARIVAAFDFVADDCVLTVLAPHAPIIAYLQAMPEYATDAARAAEILTQCGSLTQEEAQRTLLAASAEGVEHTPATRSAAIEDTERGQVWAERRSTDHRTVRVDASKLDMLIDLVGELIIAAAGANLAARRVQSVELQESTSRLADLVESVRERALQLRMVKIGATFSRFERVVNDVARELGKDIQLVISGEDTELDKTVIEKIADPLTHLVRNAIDHGIELAATRVASGKPAIGTIRLNAFHESGSIVIQVSDDGGGLKRERIVAKAMERGLIESGKTLTETEIYALIFEPGFSTAEQVTNLSGRGVGMDVVKRNITALRGEIVVRSVEGSGTTVSIRLPLTLAIINGFQVRVGKSVFVLPMDTIDECIDFACEPGQDFSNVRGSALPFVRLRKLLGLQGEPGPRESIVVIKHAGSKAGLVVDALLGEYQTVIKPLPKMLEQSRCISGSSIQGSGEVALILDVAALMEYMTSNAVAAKQPRDSVVSVALN